MKRALVDTEVLVLGLLAGDSAAARLVDAWAGGRFTLCWAAAQRAEVEAVLHRPLLAPHVQPLRAAQYLSDLEHHCESLGRIRVVNRSSDAASNLLLGLAEAGKVDVLVVAEGNALRALGIHAGVRIRTAREFAVVLATR